MRRPLVLLLTAVLVAACAGSVASPSPSILVVGGSGSPSVVPVIASSETVVGPDRILIGLLDSTGTTPIGTPDYQVERRLHQRRQGQEHVRDRAGAGHVRVGDPEPAGRLDQGRHVRRRGQLGRGRDRHAAGQAGRVDRAQPARQRHRPGGPGRGKGTFDAHADERQGAGGLLASITTDPSPDPSFYQLSEDQALVQHKPFVLVFATPAFCTSRVCGPTLEAVKAVAKGEPGMTFIQVEPYLMNYANGTLQPILGSGNSLQPNAATTAWGIQAEPWVYVVDASGTVTASYEAVVVPAELTAAIDKVKSGG